MVLHWLRQDVSQKQTTVLLCVVCMCTISDSVWITFWVKQNFPLLSQWTTKCLLLHPLTFFWKLSALLYKKHSLWSEDDKTRKCLYTVFSHVQLNTSQYSVFIWQFTEMKNLNEWMNGMNCKKPELLPGSNSFYCKEVTKFFVNYIQWKKTQFSLSSRSVS